VILQKWTFAISGKQIFVNLGIFDTIFKKIKHAFHNQVVLMRLFLLAVSFVIASTVSTFNAQAQCPPPGFPQPGNSCTQAPILCANLDGYCATINNNNTSQNFPGCPGFQLNNDEWFAFFAGSTTITMVVTPSNCSQGNNMGLQAGIYANCVSQAMDLQCQCTQNPFTLTANNFVVGQIYYMVIDGCGGNVCDYSIDVTVGSTVGVPPGNPGPITGPITACAGTGTGYSISTVPLATNYTWSLNPSSAGTIAFNGLSTTSVNWPANSPGGTAELCVRPSNGCYASADTTCVEVTIVPKPTAALSGNGQVCAGSATPVDLSVAFTGDGPWTFVYALNGTAQAPITTSDNPYQLSVTQPGSYSLVSVNTVTGNCTGNVSGSSNITQVTVAPTIQVTNANCGLSDGSINLSVTGGTAPYSFLWSNGETTEDLSMIPSGGYSVTVTDATGCTGTASANVADNVISFTLSSSITANTICNGGNGAITVTVSPTGTYTYEWSTTATTNSIAGLLPGSYELTVSAGGNCTQTATYVVPDQPNTPTLSFFPTASTCELSNGSVTMNISGGVTPYTILWDNNATSQNLTSLLAGTYSVTVTGANGCSVTGEVTVGNNNPPIDITANIIANTSCNSVGTGVVNLSINSSLYTYTWSNGATTSGLFGVLPGSYSVTVSAGGACTTSLDIEIPNEPNIPDMYFELLGGPSCGQSNGNINFAPSGGVEPYTYIWSNGATTQDIYGIPAGDYYVTITGANGCSDVGFYSVPDETIDINISDNIFDNTSCTNSGNGVINLTVTPANVTYLWSNNATTQDLSGLLPGTYTVTISAGGTCTAEESFTVEDNTVYPDLSLEITNPVCGASNGSINLDVFGGQSPLTYSWSNGSNNQDISGLAPAVYYVTVTSALGCSSVASASLFNEATTLTVSGAVFENTSCSNPNGSIFVDVLPEGYTYFYNWSNGSTTQNLSGVGTGSYTVTVSLGNCLAVETIDMITNAVAPTGTVSTSTATCGQNTGSATATAAGGVAPYSYTWSVAGTSATVSNLAPGAYQVTVTGANGCTVVGSGTIDNTNVPLVPTGVVTANNSCVSGNGSIDLSVAPSGSYTYTWSNAATSEDLSNLNSGSYTVTVSAGPTCSATASFTVTSSTSEPVISSNITAAICGQSDGAINLTVTGGTTPYTYMWSNMATTEDLSAIPSGLYSVTVNASNGCTASANFTVANNSSTFSLAGTATPLTNCQSNNGAVDLQITPVGPYDIVWSNTATTEDLSGLAAGTYTVTVTQTGSCTASITFTVEDQRLLPSLLSVVTPEICGLSNGAINLIVNGGTAPLSINWSNMATSEDLTALPAGIYSVTVSDVNGCSDILTDTVPNNLINFSTAVSVVANTSCLSSNGSITLQVTPAGSYTYSWNTGATTSSLNSLDPGIYVSTVSAGGTCVVVDTVVVDNNTPAPVLSTVVTNALCSQPTGTIDLTVSGGQSPYSYGWSNQTNLEDPFGLLPGTYTVTVTAASGCSSTTSAVVGNDSNNFSIGGQVTDNSSCAGGNGLINVTMTPAGNYSFEWSTTAVTEDVSGLTDGTYSVTVTDLSGCAINNSFTVGNSQVNPVVSGNVVNILCFGANTGSIATSVLGGVGPFTYNWSPSQPGSGANLNNIVAGNYIVTVTDALGCTAAAAFNVTQPAAGLVVACTQVQVVSIPGATDGVGAVTLSGGAGPYTVALNPGSVANNISAGTFNFPNLGEGTYQVVVTDANGCSASCSFDIGYIPCTTMVGTMSATALSACDLGCVQAVYNTAGQVLDPEDVLQFVLHSGSADLIVNELARSNQPTFCFNPANMVYGTTYYISAIAGNNDGTGNVATNDYCTAVAPGTPVVFYANPVVTIAEPISLSCAVSSVPLQASSTLSPASFSWTTAVPGGILAGANQPVATVGKAGLYQVVTTTNGCKDTATVEVLDITNQPLALVLVSPDDILDCQINEILLSGFVEGTSNGNAVWLVGGQVFSNNSSIQVTQPGVYELVILDTLTFCADTATVTIGENQAYPPLTIASPAPLTCAQPQITLTGSSPFPGIALRWAQIDGTDTLILGSGAALQVSQPGTYYLLGFDPVNGCRNIEQVTVISNQVLPVVDAGPTFDIKCFGEALPINATAVGSPLAYLWTTANGSILSGSTSLVPTITAPGTYVVLVTNTLSGCTATDEVVVNPKAPLIELEVAQPRCFGDKGSIVVSSVEGAAPPIQYEINEQAPVFNNSFGPLSAGIYELFITDAQGCTATASATIVEPQPVEISLAPVVYLRLGQSYVLEAGVNLPLSDLLSVQWEPSIGLSCDTCLITEVTPPKTLNYQVEVQNLQGCTDREEVRIEVDERLKIYGPNVFYPDGEAPNNRFTIYTETGISMRVKTLQVFTRWGEMVFENANFDPNIPELGWDGTFAGKALTPAVFVWYAIVIGPDGREILVEGDVTLAR